MQDPGGGLLTQALHPFTTRSPTAPLLPLRSPKAPQPITLPSSICPGLPRFSRVRPLRASLRAIPSPSPCPRHRSRTLLGSPGREVAGPPEKSGRKSLGDQGAERRAQNAGRFRLQRLPQVSPRPEATPHGGPPVTAPGRAPPRGHALATRPSLAVNPSLTSLGGLFSAVKAVEHLGNQLPSP